MGEAPLFWIYLTLLVTMVIRAHIFCPQTTQELPKKHHDARMPEQLTTNALSQINYRHTRHYASSQTQGQIVGRRESLNGQKNMTRRKVKNGEKSPWGQCLTRPVPNGRRSLLFFVPYIFFRPFRLSLVPTICPWVSEDGHYEDCKEVCLCQQTMQTAFWKICVRVCA